MLDVVPLGVDRDPVSFGAKPLRLALLSLTGTRLVFNAGFRFVYPFLPAVSRGLGISLAEAGALLSVRNLAGIATPIVVRTAGSGELRRRLMIAALIVFALGSALTAATTWYVGALLGFILMGVGKPVFDIAAQAYLADRTPYRKRARYLSILELTWAGGLLLGAPAAGWLMSTWGWKAPLWAICSLCAAALWSVQQVVEPDHSHSGRETGRLRLNPSSSGLLVVFVCITFAEEIAVVVIGAWLERGFSLDLVQLGWFAAAIGVAELVGEGSTLVFADQFGKRRSVAFGVVVAGVGFGVLTLTATHLSWGLAGLFVAFLGFEFTIVSAIPLASELHPAARARYLGLTVTAMALARAAGSALGPVLFERYGLPANTMVAAVGNLVALVVLVQWVRDPSPSHSEL